MDDNQNQEEIILEEFEESPAEKPQADPLLLLRADFDNYRRRTNKEMGLAQQKGRREAIERLLPAIDSLAMGLLTVPADSAARQGMEAVQRQLLTGFEQLGVKKVPTRGKPFDPAVHEAIANLPSATYPEGIVCEESRPGFQDEVGLLRAAQVIISTGAPKSE